MTEWNRPIAREPGMQLSELLRQLLWPRLLRAPGLALRAERLFVGLLIVVLLELIFKIPQLWHGQEWRDMVASPGPGFGGGPLSGLQGVDDVWMGPWYAALSFWAWGVGLVRAYPWSGALVDLLSLVVLGFGGCMICRMAACDFSMNVIVGIAEARAFTTKRIGSVLFAVIGPVLLAFLIALGLAVGGWVLFGIPYVNVLGAILYFLFLLAGAVIVILMLAYALGYPMLIPAVACEGADGIDAIGRVYPYVFSRPLRLILYYLIAGLIGWVVIGVLVFILHAIAGVTQDATTWFLGDKALTTFTWAAGTEGIERPGGGEAAAYIVNFWTGLLFLLGAAYAVSYVFCSSTIVYLLMRRLCDGQDTGELWMPGMVEGTMAESMRARANVAGTGPQPA